MRIGNTSKSKRAISSVISGNSKALRVAKGAALFSAAVAGLGTLMQSARAANDAWSTAPASANFSGTNWTTGTTTPGTANGTAASGDALYFGTSSILTLNNDDSGYTFAGLTFNSGANPFTISGNAFTLSGGITNSSTSAQIINDAMTLGASETVTTNTGSVTLGGVIDDASNGYGITKAGAGSLLLGASDTYAGATAVNVGTLAFINGTTNAGSAASSAITVGQAGLANAAVLRLDSSAATGSQTTTRGASLTFNATSGGNGFAALQEVGPAVSGAKIIDQFTGALTLNTGAYVLPALAPGSSAYSQLSFGSFVRNPGTLIDFSRGLTGVLGNTTTASQTAGNENLTFGTAPTLVGGVLIGVIVNQNLATYTAANGITPLTGQVGLAASNQTTQNASLTSTVTLTASESVNSLELGGSTGNGGTTAGAFTLTITSGMISVGQGSTLGNSIVEFNSAEGIISVQNTRNLTVNSVLDGTGGLTVALNDATSGSAYAVLNGANTYTGITRFIGNGNTDVKLTHSLALQNSTLDYNTYGGGFNFGNGGTTGQTAYTFGGLEGDQNINLNNNNTSVAAVQLTIGSTGDADTSTTVNTYGGVLSNTVAGGSIIKNGPAAEIFTGANTYSGSTTLNAGELGIDSATAIGSGAFTINGGSFDNTSSAAITLSTSNVQTWGGDFTFVGTQNLNMGTGAVTLGSSRQVTVSANTLTVGGVIGDGGSGYGLTKAGAGTLVLTGTNTFSGITSINNGAVSVNAVSTLATAQPLGENSGLNLGSSTTGGTLVYMGGSSGETLDKAIALGTGGGTISMNGGNDLSLSGTITGSGNITVNGTQAHNVVFSGVNNSNSFTGNLIIAAQTVRPGNSSNPFNANNTLSIQSGAAFNMAASSGVTFAGLNDIAGATGGNFGGGSAGSGTPLTLAGSGNYDFSGTVTFNGKVVKSGTGTQILTGANTYSGITTVSGGHLEIDNLTGSATSTGAVGLSGGTTTTLSGIGISTGALTVTAGSRLAPGMNTSGTNNNFGGVGVLSVGTTGGLTLTSANLDYDLSSSYSTGNDSISTGGTFTLTSATFNFNELNGALDTTANYVLVNADPGNATSGTVFSGITTNFIGGPAYTATYTTNGSDLEVGFTASSTPEPGSLSLLGVGAVGLMRRRRRVPNRVSNRATNNA